MAEENPFDVIVVGGGPAGLAAAEAAVEAGARVLVAEQKPSLGRKFLMAGKSGLNLTKDEDPAAFRDRIDAGPAVRGVLAGVTPGVVMAWARGLGQPVFTGSSGRVFPDAMKASPLLRAWIGRLAGADVEMRVRWRWVGFDGAALRFATPEGEVSVAARAVVMACGGGSWARLGADGAWVAVLGAEVVPFQPSNCGFVVGWSEVMQRFAGAPVKGVRLQVGEVQARGDMVISRDGIEGGAVYEVSAALRAAPGMLVLDLLPDLTVAQVKARLARPRGKASLSNHLRKVLKLTGVKAALLWEAGAVPTSSKDLAARLKALPLPVIGSRPIDQAISTAGGVAEAGLDADLMLRARPGVFCAGEMVDWDAPTGGYLITTCLATGWHAGRAAALWAGCEVSGAR